MPTEQQHHGAQRQADDVPPEKVASGARRNHRRLPAGRWRPANAARGQGGRAQAAPPAQAPPQALRPNLLPAVRRPSPRALRPSRRWRPGRLLRIRRLLPARSLASRNRIPRPPLLPAASAESRLRCRHYLPAACERWRVPWFSRQALSWRSVIVDQASRLRPTRATRPPSRPAPSGGLSSDRPLSAGSNSEMPLSPARDRSPCELPPSTRSPSSSPARSIAEPPSAASSIVARPILRPATDLVAAEGQVRTFHLAARRSPSSMSLPPAGGQSSPLSLAARCRARVEPLGRNAAVGGTVHFQIERVRSSNNGLTPEPALTTAESDPSTSEPLVGSPMIGSVEIDVAVVFRLGHQRDVALRAGRGSACRR